MTPSVTGQEQENTMVEPRIRDLTQARLDEELVAARSVEPSDWSINARSGGFPLGPQRVINASEERPNLALRTSVKAEDEMLYILSFGVTGRAKAVKHSHICWTACGNTMEMAPLTRTGFWAVAGDVL